MVKYGGESSAITASASSETSVKTSWQGLMTWLSIGAPFSLQMGPNGLPIANTNPSVSPGDNQRRFSVVIDDLEALEALAPSAQAARAFCVNLCQMLSSSSSSGSTSQDSVLGSTGDDSTGDTRSSISTLVAYGRQCPYSMNYSKATSSSSSLYGGSTQSFFNSTNSLHTDVMSHAGGNNAEPMLSEYSRYRADVTVCVQPLVSGYSSEVHGVITIKSGGLMNQPSGIKAPSECILLHFKALDSGVRCALSTG
jgi:hypothetical protein